MRYEFRIKILDKKYTDILVVALARQGYAPYITEGDEVCIEVSDGELEELKWVRKRNP